jgi:ubiquinone/menaquinone biosynthesis C-methylase UbiE
MKLIEKNITKQCAEKEIIESIELDNKNILELGCGAASNTRVIAQTGNNRNITALEVDEIQHEKNLLINDLPNVKFVLSGAQEIPLQDSSIDVVFMFKSLHHVPYELIPKAFEEIKRVLKPNGFLYISEPIFYGQYNEVLRIFHDEQKVRQNAFSMIEKFVDNDSFSLRDEIFFNDSITFNSFEEFEDKLIKATYQDHKLDDKLYEKTKKQFALHTINGKTKFLKPIRVDILQKN